MTEINNGNLILANKDANGGTEYIARKMIELIPFDLLSHFQIFHSRLRSPLDETKLRIFVAHDLVGDPESDHLKNGGWKKFHKIVFVSNWQMQTYMNYYNIPWNHCEVIHNAIDPIDWNKQNDGRIRLIYHPTPHRGLDILAPVFEKLCEKHDDIYLDVFSSFKLYGWEQRDEPYKKLFEKLESMARVTNHGTVSNEEIRKHLAQADIFAYPSVWMETSCLCLMESMSAGLICVHPNYGALFETAANWTMQYQWNENRNVHGNIFYAALDNAINLTRERNPNFIKQLQTQSVYANIFYNWELRKAQWENFLKSLLHLPRQFQTEMFSYKV